jgi:hypothetical protein
MDFVFSHLSSLTTFLVIGCFFVFLTIRKRSLYRHIGTLEQKAISCFIDRLSKIPAFIEIFRDSTNHPDICNELIRLHTKSLMSNISSLYDVAFLDNSIDKELALIKRLSLHIESLKQNPDFHYVVSYLDVYNDMLYALYRDFDASVFAYERFRTLKNLSVIGLLVPMEPRNTLR